MKFRSLNSLHQKCEIKTDLIFCLHIRMHVVEMLIDLEFHSETDVSYYWISGLDSYYNPLETNSISQIFLFCFDFFIDGSKMTTTLSSLPWEIFLRIKMSVFEKNANYPIWNWLNLCFTNFFLKSWHFDVTAQLCKIALMLNLSSHTTSVKNHDLRFRGFLNRFRGFPENPQSLKVTCDLYTIIICMYKCHPKFQYFLGHIPRV